MQQLDSATAWLAKIVAFGAHREHPEYAQCDTQTIVGQSRFWAAARAFSP
jgi:hypothetical protein